ERELEVDRLRRHVDAVARYISPADSTIDYAFMYLPAEAIYFELTLGDATNDEPDILRYCADRNVIPASPNTLLAYLQVVALGLRGLAMQERTRDLQLGISQVRREFERFVELHDQLGKHLDNATKKFDETERALAPDARGARRRGDGRGRCAPAVAPRGRRALGRHRGVRDRNARRRRGGALGATAVAALTSAAPHGALHRDRLVRAEQHSG